MLYGEAVNVPSTFELALKLRRVTTPFDADAASVGLVPRLNVVLADGLVSFTITDEVGTGVGVGVGVDETNELLPARSHEAAPPYRVNAIPFMGFPSSPRSLAGTSRRTHCPAGGIGPMERRLAVPVVPSAMKLLPQKARCSQPALFHCNI